MKSQTKKTILTAVVCSLFLCALCFATIFGDGDVNAQRGRNRSRVKAVKGTTKIQTSKSFFTFFTS